LCPRDNTGLSCRYFLGVSMIRTDAREELLPVQSKRQEKLLCTIFRRHKQRAREMIRSRLKTYNHHVIDLSAQRIVETAKRTGATVSGPIPLPTKKEVVTILRAVHKYKDSREQFERRTHKRLIDITNSTPKTVEALMSLE